VKPAPTVHKASLANICIKYVFLLSLLVRSLTADLTAQSFTNLHAFTGGGDGANPWGGLVLSNNTLYGTTYSGGSAQSGIVFAVNTDGSGFINLHDFTSGDDGANPYGGLILSGNTLYGTASTGGTPGYGTVYAVNTDGSGFRTIYSFNGTDGSTPWGGLVLSGNTLYGTAKAGGGGSAQGTVFKVNLDGSGFTTLHSFSGLKDGGYPLASLVLSGATLYGTAQQGGSSGNGTLFAISTNGTGFTNLYTFTTTSGSPLVNSDGANPWDALFLSGNTLFGTAYSGGASGNGTVFALNTNGSGFAAIHTFSTTSGPNLANQDGGNPVAGLIISGKTLYGTAEFGGTWGTGIVFSMSTNGTSFIPLYNFSTISAFNSPNSDGAYPVASLVLSGTTLYGSANSGGASGYGSIFSLTVPAAPPQLTITPAGTNVILTWSTNITGFVLQSTTNLASLAIWLPVFPGPAIVNGQNTVTNQISGTQQYYRLSQ
jgi:uncharacterized repeat protein (TIGR03803 family)